MQQYGMDYNFQPGFTSSTPEFSPATNYAAEPEAPAAGNPQVFRATARLTCG
jgi:hypothetical protein